MNNLHKYKNITDKSNSLFTILTYNITINDILNNIYKHISNTNNIKNSYKKNLIHNRLHSIISFLNQEKNTNKPYNHILLVNDSVIQIPLHKKYIKILNDYNIKNYTFIYDNHFHIDYLINLFTDFTFYNSILLNNKTLHHSLLNSTKYKIIKQLTCNNSKDLLHYIQQINSPLIIHGTSQLSKNINIPNCTVFNKKLHNNDIISIFKTNQMKLSHIKLSNCINMINNKKQLHLIIYGKLDNEIKFAIENYRIKTLFYYTHYYNNLLSIIHNDYLNFELIPIDYISSNDICHTLVNNYNGFIGIAYY